MKPAVFFDVAQAELMAAQRHFPPFHSAHEGYAVLAEEVDELWQEVKRKPAERNANAMLIELVQIAAMAARMAADLRLGDDA